MDKTRICVSICNLEMLYAFIIMSKFDRLNNSLSGTDKVWIAVSHRHQLNVVRGLALNIDWYVQCVLQLCVFRYFLITLVHIVPMNINQLRLLIA